MKDKLITLLSSEQVNNPDTVADMILALYRAEKEKTAKEKSKERFRKWYLENREKKIAYSKKWAAEHRASRNESNRKQREKRKLKALKGE